MTAKFDDEYQRDYTSLVEMWSKWNKEYFDAEFPRLFVRFEDIIFNPEEVMSAVATCAGLSVTPSYRAMLEPSKDHGSSSSLVSAMIRYSNVESFDLMLAQDIEYAQEELDDELMRQFHYVGAMPHRRQSLEETS